MVAVEEGKERRLGAGRALHATEAEVVAGTLEVAEVPEQLLEPEGRTLTNGGKLSRLEVGEAEGGEVGVFLSEDGKARDDSRQLGEEEVETVAEEDEVRVVSDIARSGTEAECQSVRAVVTHWIMPAASGATVPKVCTCAMTSSVGQRAVPIDAIARINWIAECDQVDKPPHALLGPYLVRSLTAALALLLSSDLHLSFVELEVSLHLLDRLVRDGQTELLTVSIAIHEQQLTFSAMARLSHSLRQVPKRV